MDRIAYLIPEFPGQTHIWMWREIVHLRRFGLDVHIISTRPPLPRDRARHDFADETRYTTDYIYDWRNKLASICALIVDIAWVAFTRPWRFIAAVSCCIRLATTNPKATFKLLLLLFSACRLARLLTVKRAEHLHVHSFGNSSLMAMLARRLTGIPFSQTLNAYIEIWGGFEYEKLHEATFTIAITNELIEQIQRAAPDLPPQKYALGRIGVDSENWNDIRVHPYVPGQPFRILSVGRLHPAKGHDDLLRAVASLIEEGTDVRLDILGDGPQRDDLEQLARDLHIDDQVTFHGSASESEIKRQMRSSHCFVGASYCEPLGVVFMEAMAAGLPTIGTAAGGLPDIIEHERTGLLVPPRDVLALKTAIRRLLQDNALSDRLSENGRQKIRADFDSEIGAKTLFEKLTGTP